MTPPARSDRGPRPSRARWRLRRRSAAEQAAESAPEGSADAAPGPVANDVGEQAEAAPTATEVLGSRGRPEEPAPAGEDETSSPAEATADDAHREPAAPSSATAGPDGAQPGPVTPDDRVNATLETWRSDLLELAGGSALWNIDTLGDALVELTAAHPSGVAQLFAGRRTRLSNLAREGSSLTQARRHARIVAARAEDLAQRFGVAPTYVAMGVASWFMPAPGAQTPPDFDPSPMPGHTVRVPVLLRPVRMIPVPGSTDLELELDPQVEVNAVLVRALRAHGVQVDPALLVDSTNRDHGFSPRPALETIATLGRALPDFALESRIVLGTFIHPGQALADDLAAQPDLLRSHEAVRALAGDPAPLNASVRPLPNLRLGDPDPDQEHGVGDLGAGQHRVLDAAAGGGHLFVDAPPGAESSGTIAALMAQAVAAGQRVLYVPGTHRAGAATMEALREVGLSDLALDLGNDTSWRREAATRLIDGLNPPAPDPDPDLAGERERLRRVRATLGGYIAALHSPREPWQASAYHALQALAALTSKRPGPRTQVRLSAATVRSHDDAARTRLRGLLIEAAGLGAFRLRASDTPWYGAVLHSADDADDAMRRVRDVVDTLPGLREQIAATAAQTGLDEARTLSEWARQLDLLDGIRSCLDVFLPEVFERSAADMVAATATRQWREQHGSTLGAGTRRRLRKQAKDLVRPGVAVADLHAELARAAQRREEWRDHCSGGGWPRLPEAMATITTTAERIRGDIDVLNPVLRPTVGDRDLVDVPLTELEAKFTRLADDEATLEQMPQRAALLAQLSAAGLAALVDDLTARRVATALVGAEFDLAWWSSVLEEMLTDDPAMVGLEAEALEESLIELRRLERVQAASLRDPILRAHARHVREAIAADRPGAQEFYRAVKRGEADLRTLVDRFGRVAWAPRPIWIVPPMVVPQVLPAGRTVDLVIVDAVAHLGLEQLIPALARGRQVVVVGDARRRGSATLTALGVLPRVELPADRVDRDPEIAAFLAAHGYADVIQPVPGPPRPTQIGLQVVDGSGMPAPGSDVVESVQAEVDRVVDLVIDHALSRPEESLAVIALNTRHADRVREAVALTASDSPALAGFFDPAAPEAFTVVSVEGVAGLRRDAVILSVGYGKTPHGRILHRFGPVSGSDGAGLLTDAIDACRNRLSVVACMRGDELDPGRLRSPGAIMLRDLLLFAEAGRAEPLDQAEPVERDDSTGPARESAERAPDQLLVDLAERLWRLGLTVVPRYGTEGGMRIPLAIGHPSLPGELVLAIVTDDHEYVAEPSLRRRDRHWVDRLTARGWRVRTVFSSALFMDPQGEATRIAADVAEILAERGVGTPEAAAPPGQAVSGIEVPAELVDDEPGTPAGEPAMPDSSTAHDASGAPAPVRVSARSERIAGTTTSSIPRIVTPGVRSERPEVMPGLPASGYSDDQLDAMVAWLASDGQDRVAEQYVAELRAELGLTRRSAHVTAMLTAAVARVGVAVEDPAPASEPAATEPAPTSAGPRAHQPTLEGLEREPSEPVEPVETVKPGPRRAVRPGTEDPEFTESDWEGEPAVPTKADDERILREKPPHWG